MTNNFEKDFMDKLLSGEGGKEPTEEDVINMLKARIIDSIELMSELIEELCKEDGLVAKQAKLIGEVKRRLVDEKLTPDEILAVLSNTVRAAMGATSLT